VFSIDASDRTPIYAQLERSIRVAIATRRLKVGDQLPTVRQLAVDVKVNANTVAKVYGELERAGVLETRRGVGTFVRAEENSAPRAERIKRLSDLVTKYVAEASQLGFSADEAIDYFRDFAKRGGTSHGSSR
jgi:GntR family transcriptional regulator